MKKKISFHIVYNYIHASRVHRSASMYPACLYTLCIYLCLMNILFEFDVTINIFDGFCPIPYYFQ